MTAKHWKLPFLLILFVLSMGCGSKVLYQPSPILVKEQKSLNSVRTAILDSLRQRGWTVEKDWKNLVQANYARSAYAARIQINYDTRKVSIEYLSSTNLKYQVKNGQRIIHRSYNKWITLLERDIRRALNSWSKAAPVVQSKPLSPPGNTASRQPARPASESKPGRAPEPETPAAKREQTSGPVVGSDQGAVASGDTYY